MARPSLTSAFQNWTRSELPYSERVRQAIKNTRIKLEQQSQCCGNHGEVGC